MSWRSNRKQINILSETHDILLRLGAKGDSFDDVIQRLIVEASSDDLPEWVEDVTEYCDIAGISPEELLDRLEWLENEIVKRKR